MLNRPQSTHFSQAQPLNRSPSGPTTTLEKHFWTLFSLDLLPWYNGLGWLGIPNQVTYSLTLDLGTFSFMNHYTNTVSLHHSYIHWLHNISFFLNHYTYEPLTLTTYQLTPFSEPVTKWPYDRFAIMGKTKCTHFQLVHMPTNNMYRMLKMRQCCRIFYILCHNVTLWQREEKMQNIFNCDRCRSHLVTESSDTTFTMVQSPENLTALQTAILMEQDHTKEYHYHWTRQF